MPNSKQEIFENYKINYKKHCFSKSIKISLKSDKTILVTMPIYCPFKTARNFLFSNIEKIKSYKIKNDLISKNIKTKFDTLRIIESNALKIETKKNIVYFYYPENLDFNSDIIQSKLKEAYLKALKIEAKNFLPERLNFLANKYNFKYRNIALRNQKTRFGSCSFNNNINLNINLMKYDFDCIDYVLIHELVHTKIKNHSQNFWLEVQKYCPNYIEIKKRLKNNN